MGEIYVAHGGPDVFGGGNSFCAYGALGTCCTSTVAGEGTLSKVLIPAGLEFITVDGAKTFKGIGRDATQRCKAQCLRPSRAVPCCPSPQLPHHALWPEGVPRGGIAQGLELRILTGTV